MSYNEEKSKSLNEYRIQYLVRDNKVESINSAVSIIIFISKVKIITRKHGEDVGAQF